MAIAYTPSSIVNLIEGEFPQVNFGNNPRMRVSGDRAILREGNVGLFVVDDITQDNPTFTHLIEINPATHYMYSASIVGDRIVAEVQMHGEASKIKVYSRGVSGVWSMSSEFDTQGANLKPLLSGDHILYRRYLTTSVDNGTSVHNDERYTITQNEYIVDRRISTGSESDIYSATNVYLSSNEGSSPQGNDDDVRPTDRIVSGNIFAFSVRINGKNLIKIYELSGGVWSETGSIESLARYVGLHTDGVKIVANTAVDDYGSSVLGHVGVYSKTNNTWSLEEGFTSPVGVSLFGSHFRRQLVISGDTILVDGHSPSVHPDILIYVYRRENDEWRLKHAITEAGSGGIDNGRIDYIDISGDNVLVLPRRTEEYGLTEPPYTHVLNRFSLQNVLDNAPVITTLESLEDDVELLETKVTTLENAGVGTPGVDGMDGADGDDFNGDARLTALENIISALILPSRIATLEDKVSDLEDDGVVVTQINFSDGRVFREGSDGLWHKVNADGTLSEYGNPYHGLLSSPLFVSETEV